MHRIYVVLQKFDGMMVTDFTFWELYFYQKAIWRHSISGKGISLCARRNHELSIGEKTV